MVNFQLVTREVSIWAKEVVSSKKIYSEQKKIYLHNWNKYNWDEEKLFPIRLELKDILSGSTASLHTRQKPKKNNQPTVVN